MPKYKDSPFSAAQLAMKGVPCYLLGSYDYKVGNSNLALSKVALTTDVATVTVQLLNGPAPVVGGLISIINSTAGSGEFNVSRATLTAVNLDAATGAGTLSFALTGADLGATNDSGTVICEPAEVPETLTAGASVACCVQSPVDGQFTVPVAVTFPTMPTAATVTLQKAIRDRDAEYTDTTAKVTVASSAFTAGPTVEATLERGYFYRLNVSGLTGTGTVIGKIG